MTVPTDKQLRLLERLLREKRITINQYNAAKINKPFCTILIGEHSSYLGLLDIQR